MKKKRVCLGLFGNRAKVGKEYTNVNQSLLDAYKLENSVIHTFILRELLYTQNVSYLTNCTTSF